MYKLTYRSWDGIVHIVANPKSAMPFSACTSVNLEFVAKKKPEYFLPGVATCIRCWAREFIEWQCETDQGYRRRP